MSPQPRIYSPSLITALLLWLAVGVSAFHGREERIFAWDAFGYHLYLPAAVVHDDPLLKDLTWVDQAHRDQEASGTLYQISTLDNGRHVIKYTMGLAVVWGPWFMMGHWVAGAMGYPQDGYSGPYLLAVRCGVWFYCLLGLLALRTVLRNRFSEWVTALTLLLLFIATNLIDQATAGISMPHIVLFCLYAGILWAVLRWTAHRSVERAMVLAILMGLAMLIRPSEGVCVLLPLLWRASHEEPHILARAWRLRGQWTAIMAVMFLIGLPQFIYWKAATGYWLLDTYNNAGEGLDLLSPHTGPFLFSFRKGWFIYTPLMLLAALGIGLLHKIWRRSFRPILVFFLVNLYLISSWTCWWYADSFGSRAMVGSYAVMALPLAAVLQWATGGSTVRKWSIAMVLVVCTALNLFQYWQFKHGIIHSSRMTRAAYVETFGRIVRPTGMDDLLLVHRSYSGQNDLPDSTKYIRTPRPELIHPPVAPDTTFIDSISGIGHPAYRLDAHTPFTAAFRVPFHVLTPHDHAWVELEWQVMVHSETTKGSFVATFEHNGRNYAYTAEDVEGKGLRSGTWTTIRTWYLTPEVRSKRDQFDSYFWLRDTVPLFVSGPMVTVWQPRERH